MMGFLSKIFPGEEAVSGIINTAASGLDKLHFGEQEQAEHALKARGQAYEVIMQWLESTSGSRVARRFLAIASFLVWVSFYLLAALLSVLAVWVAEPKPFTASAGLLMSYGSDMKPIIAMVFAFYFGGPVVMEGMKPILGKWVNKG